MSASQLLDRPGDRKLQSSHARYRGERAFMHRAATLLWGLLSIVLLVSGACMLLAGIASYQAEAFIDSWDGRSTEPGASAWKIAHSAAKRSISLYPVADGARLDRLARIYSWKQFHQPYADPAAQESRHAALDAYRAAVAARPSWPYTWAGLAHSKLELQEFDGEFDEALVQAFQLGPWRIGVNLELVEIGLNAWPYLNQVQRLAVLESARRSVSFGYAEAQNVLELAQGAGRLRVLCDGLSPELRSTRKLSQCSGTQ